MSEVRLPQGPVRYSDGGSGPPVVLVHGLLVNGLLWRDVVSRLERDFRCIVPELPLGSHPVALDPSADLTPPGLARLVADFLAALDLEDVTLVGNDTGGAISQLVATRHPERLGRLVLTPCDAYDNFPPPAFRYLQWVARVPGLPLVAMQSMRVNAMRNTPLAFGWLAKRRMERDMLDAFVTPVLKDRGVRRDLTKVLRGIDPSYTLEAAERLRSFDQPTLIAWAPEDRFFKLEHAERLAAAIPDARLERIDDSYTFVSIDQPERTAELIGSFARAGTRERQPSL